MLQSSRSAFRCRYRLLISALTLCVLFISGTVGDAQDHSGTRSDPIVKQPEQSTVGASLRAAIDEQQKKVDAVTTPDERLNPSKRLANLEIQLSDALAAQGQYAETGEWYARANKLREENYQTEKASLEDQISKLEALAKTKRADLTLTADERANFLRTYQTIIDGLLSQLDSLASERNDSGTRLTIAERRLTLARDNKDATTLAAALQAAGEAQRKAGDLAAARAAAEQALQIRQDDPRRTFIYDTVRLLAWIADDANDWHEAEARYREVIELTRPRALPDLFDLNAETDADTRRAKAQMNARDLLNRERTALDSRVYLADILEKQGNFGQAAQQFKAIAADVTRLYAIGADDQEELAKWIADREQKFGSLIDQLKSQVRATEIVQHRSSQGANIDDATRLAFADTSAKSLRAQLATKYAALLADEGQLDDAAKAFQGAITLFQNVLGGSFPVVGLDSALARIEKERGNYDAAEAALKTALTIYQSQHDLSGIASVLAQQSGLRLEQNRPSEAMQLANDALQIARPLNYRPQIAGLLRALGRAESEAGGDQLKLSEQHLRESLAVWRDLGLQAHVAYTLSSLGVTLEKQGRIPEALNSYEEAVKIIELLTRSISSEGSSDVFNSSTGNRELYDRLIRLLLKVGRTTDALGYLERAKSKSLKDALAGAKVKTPNPSLNLLVADVGGFEDSMRMAETELSATASATRPDSPKLAHARAQLADTQQRYLQSVKAIQQANPLYASFVAVTPTDLIEVRRRLPPGTALLEFFPTDTELYIFAMMPGKPPIVRSSPIGRADLATLIARYRGAISVIEHPDNTTADAVQDTKRKAFWQDDGSEIFRKHIGPLKQITDRLYRALITPVEADVAAADTLLLIPAGEIYYLPIHALGRIKPDGEMDFLLERKRLAYLSSADLVNVITSVKQNNASVAKPRPLVAMANPDPIYNGLESASLEADALRRLFPNASIYKEKEATLEHFKEAAGQVRYVHFATHGFLEADPKESFLLLAGQPKQLTVRAIVEDTYGLNLNGVDLVTLSACTTNLGGFEPGAKYSSLSRAFAKAGAPTVVASLWEVDDESTKETMMTFYQELAAGQPKGEALRRAQLALMRNPKYAHPYFWSAFVLMGDWR